VAKKVFCFDPVQKNQITTNYFLSNKPLNTIKGIVKFKNEIQEKFIIWYGN